MPMRVRQRVVITSGIGSNLSDGHSFKESLSFIVETSSEAVSFDFSTDGVKGVSRTGLDVIGVDPIIVGMNLTERSEVFIKR